MSNDSVVYLNKKPFLFDSRLRQQIEAAKISKMPTSQWEAFINGLSSKGVKKDEVNDSQILTWLKGGMPSSPPSGASVTKDEVLSTLERLMVTVKEVTLGRPQYAPFSHGGLAAGYKEILFIANSERANVEDRLEEIEFQMEALGFDVEQLAADPEKIIRLEKERAELMRYAPKAYDFHWRHFNSQDIQGRHGKNLIAHARITIHDGLFFIEEIQSDWGQSGRIRKSVNDQRRKSGLPELQWNDAVPKGPFVTETRLWAGLVLRRLLQRAAMMPDIDRVAWIRLCMQNGGKINPADEDAKKRQAYEQLVSEAVARGEEPPPKPVDESDQFYMRVIPSIADSMLGKSGVKVGVVSEVIDGHRYDSIPGFQMTEQAREALKGVQPLYSASAVLRNPKPVPDRELVRLLRGAKAMLGSAAHIRFVDRLYNLKDMTPVSGSYMNRLIHVALNAADVEFALNHEAYHFAHENLLSPHQRRVILDSFAPGSELNIRVRDALLRQNQAAAAAQCSNPEEAAAHGFALWCKGGISLDQTPPQGIFAQIVSVIKDGLRWISGTAQERNLSTPEEVFVALRRGEFVSGAAREDSQIESPQAVLGSPDPQSGLHSERLRG